MHERLDREQMEVKTHSLARESGESRPFNV